MPGDAAVNISWRISSAKEQYVFKRTTFQCVIFLTWRTVWVSPLCCDASCTSWSMQTRCLWCHLEQKQIWWIHLVSEQKINKNKNNSFIQMHLKKSDYHWKLAVISAYKSCSIETQSDILELYLFKLLCYDLQGMNTLNYVSPQIKIKQRFLTATLSKKKNTKKKNADNWRPSTVMPQKDNR